MARGTHGRQGPPPDPDALRRERASDAAGWVTLSRDGRASVVPSFPLAGPSDRELMVWAEEWDRPQSVMWESNGQGREVALYVRALVAAEQATATAAERVLVLRLMEQLGLSVPGLARNKWRFGEVAGAAAAAMPVDRRGVGSARDRLRVVKGA